MNNDIGGFVIPDKWVSYNRVPKPVYGKALLRVSKVVILFGFWLDKLAINRVRVEHEIDLNALREWLRSKISKSVV